MIAASCNFICLFIAYHHRCSQFWLLWSMIISSATAGLNTASAYKYFAATSSTLDGDQYQALVGGIGGN